MGAKGPVIEPHQLALAHGGGGLQFLHQLGPLVQAQFNAAQPHGTTGDQGHPMPPLAFGAETCR